MPAPVAVKQPMLLEKLKDRMRECTRKTGLEYERAPDGGWGWVVVFAALCNLGFMYGTVRSLGVFFVPMMETFDTNAGTTSWVVSTLMGCSFACVSGALVRKFGSRPVAMAGGVFVCPSSVRRPGEEVRQPAGRHDRRSVRPVSGALVRKFGSRPVAMTGGVFVCAGYLLSSFATTIYHVYVTLGLVAGVGTSLTHVASTSIVGRYFDRRRGLANSLALMGTCVGSFALPPLFQLLIDEYGMRGSFVIVAGLELHVCAFSSFFRPIRLKADAVKQHNCVREDADALKLRVEDVDGPESSVKRTRAHGEVGMPENPLKRTFAYEEIEGPCVRENEEYGPENSVKPRRLLVKLRNPAQEDGPKNSAKCTVAHEEIDVPVENPLRRSFALLEEDEENPSEAAITHAANRTLCCCNIIDKSLFRVPSYLVHIGSMMLFTFSFPTLIFFIVPRARFLGIEEYSAAFLLSVNAISDVIGRLSSGLIMSYRPSPVKRLWLAVIPLALLGLTSLVFPLATTYTLMLALCVLFGMFSGLFVPTIVTLIPDFVGIAKLPQALGTLLMFQGVMSLLGSPAVGWLFDITGNYNVSFLLCGSTIVASALVNSLNHNTTLPPKSIYPVFRLLPHFCAGWLFDITGNYNVSFLLCGSTIVASALVRLVAHCIMGDMGLCRSTADRTTQRSAVNTDEAEQRTLLKTVPPFNDEPVVIEVETTV
ncbi:hypothetical protein Bbelb_229570 [Branchiostoma belcheri]|nr:hypothetical protein Bbelb_229570 [Branchiostoma belcheri]